MVDHKRLYTLLQMIQRLNRPGGYQVVRLASLFSVTTRTIYRYIELIRECGFQLVKTGGRYHMEQKSHTDQLLPLLSFDEATLLRDAVLAIDSGHSGKANLLKKLDILADPGQLAEMIVDASTAKVIRQLIHAVRERKEVILRDYHSPNSRSIRDRRVEPVGFSVNLGYLYAYDPEQRMVRQFKPERISGVVTTGRIFVVDERHRVQKPDLFGMNGAPTCRVTLRLNLRAWRLLLEEYPESGAAKPVWENDAPYSTQTGGEKLELQLPVNGFEGVGRFVLGLPGEAEPLGPPEFLRYLEERAGSGKPI